MLDFDFYVATPRLAITYFNPDLDSHIDFITDLYGARELAASTDNFKWDPIDREGAVQMIKDRAEQIETTGFGRYLVSLLPESIPGEPVTLEKVKAAKPIGVVTLNLRGPGSLPLPDAGFRIMSSQRGKGFAPEAINGLLKYYEEEKGVTEFLAYCEPINEPSKKVLRKVGFEELGLYDVSGISSDGSIEKVLQWSRGLKKDISEYKAL